MRVPYPELQNTLSQILLKLGFEPSRAALCARLFADASRDGVHSHGLNRFAQFIRMINTGIIDIHAHAEPVVAFGALERWDGRRGPGNLNAYIHLLGRAGERGFDVTVLIAHERQLGIKTGL
jgi:3-dehydro-L-gulonate 2-dehydrogenase